MKLKKRLLRPTLSVFLTAFILVSCGNSSSGNGINFIPGFINITSNLIDTSEAEVNSNVVISWFVSPGSTQGVTCSAFGDWSGEKQLAGIETVSIKNIGQNTYGLICKSMSSNVSALSNSINIEGFEYLKGVCVDGYIRGSNVFIDENDNFKLDYNNSELNTSSDNDGSFAIKNVPGVAVCDGGFDLDSGSSLENLTINSAKKNNPNQIIVSPLTSVSFFLDDLSNINNILGIDSSINIETDDPVPMLNVSPESNFYYEKLNQLSILALSTKNIINQSNYYDFTTTDVFRLIAKNLEELNSKTNELVNIESKNFIENLIQDAYISLDLEPDLAILDDISTALSYVLPIIQPKEENFATIAAFNFGITTFQNDLIDYLNDQSDSKITNDYIDDIIEYISIDQSVTKKDITPIVYAVDDAFVMEEDSQRVLNVLNNDSFLFYVPYTVTILSENKGKSFIENNKIIYNPDSDFFGTDTITYELSQGDRSATAIVNLDIQPINDPPRILNQNNLKIAENTTFVSEIDIEDVDSSVINLYIGGDDSDSFKLIDRDLYLNEPADFETKSNYLFSISANDGQLESLANFSLDIQNVNDNYPVINVNSFSINENSLYVGNVNATDIDGDNLFYSVSNNNFLISNNGDLSLKLAPDFELFQSLYTSVIVSDGLFSTSKDLEVIINNLNDNAPIFNEEVSFSIDEGQKFIKQISAFDPDGDILNYKVNPDIFDIDENGNLFFKLEGDYEENSQHLIEIFASDGLYESTFKLNLLLNNINDNSPTIKTKEFIIGENTSYIGKVEATDIDGDDITYSVTSNDFTISENGELRLINPSDYFEKSFFTVPVTVSDSKFSTQSNINVSVTQEYVRGIVVDGYIKDSQCGYLDDNNNFVKVTESDESGKFSLPLNLISTASKVTCVGGKDVRTNIDLEELTLSSYSILSLSDLIIISPVSTLADTYNKSGASESLELTKLIFGIPEGIDIQRADPVALKNSGISEALYWETNNQIALTVLLLQKYLDHYECAISNQNAFDIYSAVSKRLYAENTETYVDIETQKYMEELLKETKSSFPDCFTSKELTQKDLFIAKMLAKAISLVSVKDFSSYEDAIYAWILSTFSFDFEQYLNDELSEEKIIIYDTTNLTEYVNDTQGTDITQSEMQPDPNAFDDIYFIGEDQKIIQISPLNNDDYIRDVPVTLSLLTFPKNGSLSGDLSSGFFEYSAFDTKTREDVIEYQIRQGVKFSTGKITIFSQDIVQDDTPPVINISNIQESLEDGDTFIGYVSADEDVTWVISGNDKEEVYINEQGEIYLKSAANALYKTSYSFTIAAVDLNNNSSSLEILILIDDITPPILDISNIESSIKETHTVLGHIVSNEEVSYISSDARVIIDSDGILILSEPIDYEKTKNIEFIITATDVNGNLFTTETIVIAIINVNDNAPQITSSNTFNINENQINVGSIVFEDLDNDELTFSISNSNMNIDEYGAIFFKEAPDYENKKSYLATVTITDGVFSVLQEIVVNIINVNDIAPIITSSFYTAPENQTAIGQVSASDPEGDSFNFYILDNDEIQITSDGYLSFINPADYEEKIQHSVVVHVTDGINTSSQEIIISILDSNDNAPIFLSSSIYTLDENNTYIGVIEAVIGNGNVLEYSSDSSDITISSSGEMSFIQAPDYEVKNTFTFSVFASDGPNTSSQVITVNINNLNDSIPIFTLSDELEIYENEVMVSKVTASDADGDEIEFSTQSNDFIVNNEDFILFKTAPNYEEKSIYSLIIEATDGVNEISKEIIVEVLDVNEPPLISLSNKEVIEDDGKATFVIKLSNAYDEEVSFDVQTIAESASADLDYIPINQKIVVEPNVTEYLLDIKILADVLDEYNETLKIIISNPVNSYIESDTVTLTIIDSDTPPTIDISSPSSIIEGETIDYVYTLSNPSGKDISFDYKLRAYEIDQNYINFNDFDNLSGTLEIPPGSTGGVLSINSLEDLYVEPNEIFTIEISNALNVNTNIVDSLNSVNTILINTTFAKVSIQDVLVDESIGTFTLPLTIDVIPILDVEIDYQTVSKSANVIDDFTSTSGTLVFSEGNLSQLIEIPINDDLLDEPDENFELLLTTPVNAILVDDTSVVTIIDNDITSISFENLRISESIDPTINVTLTQADSNQIEVDYELVGITAIADEDFVTSSGKLTFEPGETTKGILIDFIDDNVRENDELLKLVFSNNVNVSLPVTEQTITILDNEITEQVNVSPSASSEGNEIEINLSLAQPSEKTLIYSYSTESGDALSNQDYIPVSGEISFAPGETSKSISIKTIEDNVKEKREFFNLKIVSIDESPVIDYSKVYIVDNDTTNISITDGGASEDEGFGNLSVILSNAASTEITSRYIIKKEGSNEVLKDGEIIFAPGVIRNEITITFDDDELDEDDEVFIVELFDSNADFIDDGIAEFTIFDNDIVPVIDALSAAIVEQNKNAEVNIALSAQSGRSIVVEYFTEDETALSNINYMPQSGTLTFNPGDQEKTVFIPIINNSVFEDDITFKLSLRNGENVEIGSQAIITIINNDLSPIISTVEEITISENQESAEITFALSKPSKKEITFNYSTSSGTASLEDYIPISGSVVLPRGTFNKTISIPIIDDLIDENNETYKIIYTEPRFASLALNSSTIKIKDNDFPPSAEFFDTQNIIEGEAIEIPVSLNLESGLQIEIDYEIRAGPDNPSDFNDFNALSGKLIFLPGESQKSILIETFDDRLDESNETIQILLTDSSNVNLTNNSQIITLIDNDSSPQLNLTTNSIDHLESDLFVTNIIAEDDDGDDLLFSLTGKDADLFVINNLGELSLKNYLDFESVSKFTYEIDVIVSDGFNTDTATLNLNLIDVNDVSPSVEALDAYQIVENVISVGIIQVEDIDSDNLTYSIKGDDANSFIYNENSKILNFVNAPDFEEQTSYNIIFEASDGQNITQKNIAITIININDEAPEITSSNIFNVNDNSLLIGSIEAIDPDGDDISFVVNNDEMVISEPGLLKFKNKPNYNRKSKHLAEIQVTDGLFTTSQSIEVLLLDATEPKISSDVGIVTVDDNNKITVSFTINDGDINIGTLFADEIVTWSLQGNTRSYDIDQNGQIFLSEPANAFEQNLYSFIVIAIDQNNNRETINILVNVNDITAPVISLEGDTSVTVELGSSYTDAGATTDDGSEIRSSGTVNTNTLGTYTITYTAEDSAGNTSTATRTITVVDTTAPVITLLGDNPAEVELGSSYTDAGATTDDGSEIRSSGTVNTNTLGTYTITYTAEDSAGNTSTATRTITVVDTTAPVITLLGDNPAEVELGSSYTDAGATTDDGSEIRSSGTVNTNTLGTYTITYTAEDSAGNTSTATRTITVVDTTAPVITLLGDNPAEVELGSSYTDAGATTDDGSEIRSSGTVNTNTLGTYTITYTAEDSAGNTSTATRTITVVDTTAPVITLLGDNPAEVELGSSYTDAGATTDDGSEIRSSGTVNTNTLGTYTITYTAEDSAGNTSTATRTITVVDTTAPVITLLGDNPAEVELGSSYTDAGATTDDGSEIRSSGTVDVNTVGTYTSPTQLLMLQAILVLLLELLQSLIQLLR